MSERRAAGRGDSQKGKEGLLLFDSLVFIFLNLTISMYLCITCVINEFKGPEAGQLSRVFAVQTGGM